MLSADPEDYSSAVRYNATFCQTAVTDTQTPAIFAVSSPILINITDDDIFEGVEYFQVRIVETSDSIRVRIGQDTVNVTITDGESLTGSGNTHVKIYDCKLFPYSSFLLICLCLVYVVVMAYIGKSCKCCVAN